MISLSLLLPKITFQSYNILRLISILIGCSMEKSK